ncbi:MULTISPECIES: universal stress protein [unclassified Streptomyces]|uniref:universal stress protein n=1 Tax=unclassified Streptomyces TaxID=2593676 RepID=UPI0037F46B3E
MNPVVTVGLDGTPESLSAAHWAAREAESRGATLRLLHAWVLLDTEPAEGKPASARHYDQNYWSERILREALATVEEHCPELSIVEELVAVDPVHALLEAAAESELLVLGSRDLAPLAGYFLGDIGMNVMARSVTPTALVRAGQDTVPGPDDGEVVVALGLRGPCDELLAFAFDSAARRGAVLRAVHGRNLPAPACTRGGPDPYPTEEAAKDAGRELAEALRPWREKFPGVRTTDTVRMESPARAVVRGAAGAGLLVVGRRRTRPVFAPKVGHVLSAAVHHAACPVVIVPYG